MRSLNWTFTLILGLLLALVAPVSLFAGLVLYLQLFHTPYAAALGWLLYFLPVNALGGFALGVVQGVLFQLLYTKKSAKAAWVGTIIAVILTSIANAYEVWTVILITFILNFLLLFVLYRLIFLKKYSNKI